MVGPTASIHRRVPPYFEEVAGAEGEAAVEVTGAEVLGATVGETAFVVAGDVAAGVEDGAPHPVTMSAAVIHSTTTSNQTFINILHFEKN